jgi:hypothetical protein
LVGLKEGDDDDNVERRRRREDEVRFTIIVGSLLVEIP